MSGLGRKLVQRAVLLSLVLAMTLGVAIAAFVPFMQEQVSAAGTALNLPQRDQKIKPRENRSIAFGTCEPYWGKITKTRQVLQDHFYPDMDGLPYKSFDNPNDEWNWLVNEYDERTVDSRIGNDFGDQQVTRDDRDKIDRVARMLQLMGKQEIPVIRFRAASSGSSPLDGNYSANGSVCGSYVMLPVNYPSGNPPKATSWRGFEFWNSEEGAHNPESAKGEFMEFTLETVNNKISDNKGKLNYWGKTNGGELLKYFTNKSFTIDGTYPSSAGSGTNPNVGTINASWVDAATISINNSPQNFAGEVYKKRSWNTRQVGNTYYSYYFLDKASSGRENRTWGNNSKKCEEALPLSSACGGGGICVPFIAVKQKLNVDHNDTRLNRLQNDINQLGSAQAELYDFTSNCVADARYTIALSDRDNAKIWLYYSSSQKALTPVFTTGDGNEAKYIGMYSESRAPTGPQGQSGEYKLGECIATITGNPIQTTVFGVNWALTDGNCGNVKTYGEIGVKAMGGTAGEAAFTQTLEEQQDAGQDLGNSEAKLICNLTSNAFTWVFCPITTLALEAIEFMETIINDTLTLKTDRIFNSEFRDVWTNFRTLALALIVIAALIMVISQGAGVELLDAYTVRKVLPRLLFATIAITLSWPIMEFLVNLSNDAGSGIRYLIYAPFPNETNVGALGGLLVTLLTGGALVAFGVLGALSFILTGLLAAAVAFCVIVFRELLVMFLVMSAPFAIACYVLPSTQKIWEMWKNAFIAALMVFAIISAFIALGRVFAIIALGSGGNGTFNQIIAIVAYILPYFLITTAFRMAGGVMSAVGGIVNDRTKGGFDRLRNFRDKQREDRAEAWKNREFADKGFTTLFRPDRRGPGGAIGRGIQAVNRRTTAGIGMGFGDKSKARMALQGMEDAQRTLDNKRIKNLANMDDANAVLFLSTGRRDRAEEAARNMFTDDKGVYDAARGSRAIAAASVVGFTEANARAAALSVPQNKARAIKAGRIDLVQNAIKDLSHGNAADAAAMSYQFMFDARNGGRSDLGGDWMDPKFQTQAALHAAKSRGIVPPTATDWSEAQTNLSAANTSRITQQMATTPEYQKALRSLVSLDGAKRTEVRHMLNAYPDQTKQLIDSIEWALTNGNDNQKMEASRRKLELVENLSQANGAVQEVIIDRFQKPAGNRPALDFGRNLGEQIADQVSTAMGRSETKTERVSVTELRNGARAFNSPGAFAQGGGDPNASGQSR